MKKTNKDFGRVFTHYQTQKSKWMGDIFLGTRVLKPIDKTPTKQKKWHLQMEDSETLIVRLRACHVVLGYFCCT